mmetsp:Transcript_41058/g.76368  ORF Transcript_41058/g.76368 Transcript_41058/m.76368 type:complete len:190 (-) Transcript_41058:14-583(-)
MAAALTREDANVDADMQDVLRMRERAGYIAEDELPAPYVAAGDWSLTGELPGAGASEFADALESLSHSAQDIWHGAAGGIPLPETSVMSAECVAGAKKSDAAARLQLVKGLPRIDERLLRTRLSHLTETVYDVQSDVIRPHGWTKETPHDGEMAVEEEDLVSCVFQRRELAQQVKANRRRPEAEDGDIL